MSGLLAVRSPLPWRERVRVRGKNCSWISDFQTTPHPRPLSRKGRGEKERQPPRITQGHSGILGPCKEREPMPAAERPFTTDLTPPTDAAADPRIEAASTEYLGRWNRLVSTTNWEKGQIICQWRAALIEAGRGGRRATAMRPGAARWAASARSTPAGCGGSISGSVR